MPTINLPEKKKSIRYKPDNRKDNINHKTVYNTNKWRELRLLYLQNNPLCEMCLEKEIIKSAIDVHHKKELSSTDSVNEKKRLGFDYSNLKSLCKECHKEVHNH